MQMPIEIERIIAQQMVAGLYASEAEVMQEALRLLAQRDHLRLERIAEVNDAIQLGLEQAERGEMISAEALKADLDQLFASFEGQSGAI